jgi:ADP-heptose:LPS heptosyltransferase
MKARRKTLFSSVNLIGDTISQTPAIRRYRSQHPKEEVHWVMQDEPARCLFEGMVECGVCDRVIFDNNWERIRAMDYPGYDKRFRMDVSTAFEIGQAAHVHIAQAYGRMIGIDVPLAETLPSVPVRKADLDAIGVPPRCLVISPKSSSNAPTHGFAGNKNLPWAAWPQIVTRFVDAGRVENHVVLLREDDSAPEVPLCVLRMKLSLAVAYIAKACAEGGAYCGVDNGITHLAAGLGVPTFCVYSAGIAEGWVGYSSFAHYRIAKTIPWEGNVNQIWECWKHRLP